MATDTDTTTGTPAPSVARAIATPTRKVHLMSATAIAPMPAAPAFPARDYVDHLVLAIGHLSSLDYVVTGSEAHDEAIDVLIDRAILALSSPTRAHQVTLRKRIAEAAAAW